MFMLCYLVVLCWFSVALCPCSTCVSVTIVFPLSASLMVSLFVDTLYFTSFISFYSFLFISYVILNFFGDFYYIFAATCL
jgi:hypothetical protein